MPWDTGWVSPLNRALYPPESERRRPESGDGCPEFESKDTVLERPNGDPAGPTTVAPGQYRCGDDDSAYRVVWWSPESKVLTLEADPPLGLRREDLVVKDVPHSVRERYLNEYREWQKDRRETIARASVPGHNVCTATAAADDAHVLLDTGHVHVERLAIDATRPRGVRFGTLVHALLADAPFDTSGPTHELEMLTTAHGRLLGATEQEMHAARLAVAEALRHPVLRRAAVADSRGVCFRETPVTGRLPTGVIVEGTVDLAFEEDEALVVVDFKTDHEWDDVLEGYTRQVQLYVSAIAEATGRPVRGVVMRV
jgi:ATP-dependent exoDNAse (exonuclease V) beta subunit